MNHSEITGFIWGVADLIRDTFKRGKYQDVILPLTVLRRLDCVLAPTKEKLLVTKGSLKGKLENLDPQLRKASGFAFYHTSLYDFEKLLAPLTSLQISEITSLALVPICNRCWSASISTTPSASSTSSGGPATSRTHSSRMKPRSVS